MNTMLEERPNTIREFGQKGQVTPLFGYVSCLGISCSRGSGVVWLGGRVEVFIGCQSNIHLFWILMERECNAAV
jgi:hypothetical protein